MSCSRRHRKIALYAGGDLDAADARRVEEHIAGCAPCRDLVESLAADRTTLAQLDARGSVDVELGSIRGVVAGEIGTRRPVSTPFFSAPRPVLAGAVAVAVVAASAVVVLRTQFAGPQIAEDTSQGGGKVVGAPPEGPGVESPRADLPTPGVPAEVTPIQRPEPRHRIVRAEQPSVLPTVSSPSIPPEPMVMKILTDDPEVVIYWIVEAKGEEKHV